MGSRYEIRLSGSGGQGLILMGIILAEAIGIYDGKYVAQTQSYGPEARGGSSKSEVIVSDEEIDYPKVMSLDLAACGYGHGAWRCLRTANPYNTVGDGDLPGEVDWRRACVLDDRGNS